MKQFSSLDLHFLVKEFKILEDSRVETFYLDDEVFNLKCYVKGKGHFFLRTKIGKYIFLDNKKDDSASQPKSFAQYLRKYLKNAFLRKIEQIEGERILKITLEKKEDEIKTYFIFIEVFGAGNIVLTDNNLVIKNSLIKKTFKDRKVKVHETYELPPKKEFSFSNPDKEKILAITKTSNLSVVKFLAIEFGIGGKYAEEILACIDIDKNEKSSDVNFDLVLDSLKKIVNKKIDSTLYFKDDKLNDVEPFEFKSIKLESKKIESFNKAVEKYVSEFEDTKQDQRDKEFLKEVKKLEKRLEKQLEQQKHTQEEYEKLSEVGNKIYENYALIENLLNQINKAAKEKGWKYVEEKIKSDEKLSKLIKKLNYKNNEIEVEL